MVKKRSTTFYLLVLYDLVQRDEFVTIDDQFLLNNKLRLYPMTEIFSTLIFNNQTLFLIGKFIDLLTNSMYKSLKGYNYINNIKN